MKILTMPNDEQQLRKKAFKVNVVDSLIRQTLDEMLRVMYASGGIGLAATQVGILKRLVVIDLGFVGGYYKMINPQITERSEETIEMWEGCLSVPELEGNVKRSKNITVKYLNEKGKLSFLKADDLLAVCIQHEIQHLDGVLFTDQAEETREPKSAVVV